MQSGERAAAAHSLIKSHFYKYLCKAVWSCAVQKLEHEDYEVTLCEVQEGRFRLR